MKKRTTLKQAVTLTPIALAAMTASAPAISWNINQGGNWSDTTRWLGGANTVAAGDTVNLTFAISAGRIVTMDTTSRTFGILNTGDADGTHSFTLATSGGAVMFLDNGASAAQINQVSTSKGDSIQLPISLSSALTLSNASSNALTFSTASTIASNTTGLKVITNSGGGTGGVTLGGVISDGGGSIAIVQNSTTSSLSLTNAGNTFTGGVSVHAGTLIASAGRFGSGGIVLGVTGSSTAAAVLGSSGGTSANAITVTSGGLRTIGAAGGSGIIYNGAMALNGALTVDTQGAGDATLGGVITGSSTITVVNSGASTARTVLSGLSDGSFTGEVAVSSGATLSLGMTTNASFANVISGSGNVVRNAGNVVTLGTANTYTGKTSILQGVLRIASFNSVVNGTATSSLGAPTTADNGKIALGNGNSTVRLEYTGGGETTDRVVDLTGSTGSATLQNDGDGALVFTNPFTVTGAGTKTLTIQGSNPADNSLAGGIADQSMGTNKTNLTKNGTGLWILGGTNGYTGVTTITQGRLKLNSANTIADTSSLVMNGGTLDTGGFNHTQTGTLGLSGSVNSTIDLTGTSKLILADSSVVAWTAGRVLTIADWSGDVAGSDAEGFFVGTSAGGLTTTQLDQIQFIDPEGLTAGTWTAMQLSTGEIVPGTFIPEPGGAAMILAAGALSLRRRARTTR